MHHLHGFSNALLASEHKVSYLELETDAYFSELEAQRDYAAWQAEVDAAQAADRAAQEHLLTAQLATMTDAEQDDWFSAEVERRDQGQAHAHYCGDCRSVGWCDLAGCQELIVNVCPACWPTTELQFRPAVAAR